MFGFGSIGHFIQPAPTTWALSLSNELHPHALHWGWTVAVLKCS